MKPKTYKIKNFNDLFKVMTLENYDRFTADFLIMFHKLMQAKETMTEEEIKAIKFPYFTWIDDNECRSGYKFNGGEIIWTNDKNRTTK